MSMFAGDGPLSIRGQVYEETVVINGVPVVYAVRDAGHLGLIHMHVRREINSCEMIHKQTQTET